jgi:hypothetical protein
MPYAVTLEVAQRDLFAGASYQPFHTERRHYLIQLAPSPSVLLMPSLAPCDGFFATALGEPPPTSYFVHDVVQDELSPTFSLARLMKPLTLTPARPTV